MTPRGCGSRIPLHLNISHFTALIKTTVEFPDKFELKFKLGSQPNDTSCGPTCLQAVYRYYGHIKALEELIQEIPELEMGGTLAVHLGIHALKSGFKASLYTFNLRIFDPTWFTHERDEFRKKLETQTTNRPNAKQKNAAKAYLKFHDLGGRILLHDLNNRLIRKFIRRGFPILTGLSSTFLYRTSRDIQKSNEPDDMLGEPTGHFVVLKGYDKIERKVIVADPYRENPISGDNLYVVRMDRLINSILLGVLTYDANLLVIYPDKTKPL